MALISDEDDLKKITNFEYKTDFSVNTASIAQDIQAPVVFVGYGFKDEKYNYDDFKGVDVKGKFILRLAGFPGDKDTSSKAYKLFKPEGRWADYSVSRNKNKLAEELGAIGVIEVNLDRDVTTEWATNIPFRYNENNYEGESALRPGMYQRMSIPGDTLKFGVNTIRITERLANEIIKNSGISFSEFEKLAQEKMAPDSKEIKNKIIHLKTTVKSNIVNTRNVLGMIEGENPDEIVIIGAHYDHEGTAKGYIWNGSR